MNIESMFDYFFYFCLNTCMCPAHHCQTIIALAYKVFLVLQPMLLKEAYTLVTRWQHPGVLSLQTPESSHEPHRCKKKYLRTNDICSFFWTSLVSSKITENCLLVLTSWMISSLTPAAKHSSVSFCTVLLVYFVFLACCSSLSLIDGVMVTHQV